MRHILMVSVTAPICSRTVPFGYTLWIVYGPLQGSWPNLVFDFSWYNTLSPSWYWWGILFLLWWRWSLWICACHLALITSQLTWNWVFSMASCPNTSCADVALRVVCTVALIANMVALNIPPHGSFSSSSMSWTWKVPIMFPIVWCIRSRIPLACGFFLVVGDLFMP